MPRAVRQPNAAVFHDLANRTLRAGSAFTLVGFDDLTPAERQGLASLRGDGQFYGVLKPRDPNLPVKSVSRDAALLLLVLREPRRVPALLGSLFGDDPRALLGLLADRVIEVDQDGRFVSGPEALRVVSTRRTRKTVVHRTAGLSLAAIACAARHEGLDAAELTGRVYAYGRDPCTSAIRRRFADDAELLSFLCGEPGVARLLASRWTGGDADDDDEHWLGWSTRETTGHLRYKLYVSARLEAMPRLFAMTVRAMKATGGHRFKVGRRGEGVCRPDKLVAYFASMEALQACAGRVEKELRDSDVAKHLAHGVAFTAPIDEAGFLAWGIDPPDLGQVGATLQHQSFRQWTAGRVAAAVLSAKASGCVQPSEIVPFALERVALDGIDPATWTPNLALWRDHAARPEDVA